MEVGPAFVFSIYYRRRVLFDVNSSTKKKKRIAFGCFFSLVENGMRDVKSPFASVEKKVVSSVGLFFSTTVESVSTTESLFFM